MFSVKVWLAVLQRPVSNELNSSFHKSEKLYIPAAPEAPPVLDPPEPPGLEPPLLEPAAPPLLEPEAPPLLEPEAPPLLEPEAPPLLEPEAPPLLEPEAPPLAEPPLAPEAPPLDEPPEPPAPPTAPPTPPESLAVPPVAAEPLAPSFPGPSEVSPQACAAKERVTNAAARVLGKKAIVGASVGRWIRHSRRIPLWLPPRSMIFSLFAVLTPNSAGMRCYYQGP
jgi:hypothetical protein